MRTSNRTMSVWPLSRNGQGAVPESAASVSKPIPFRMSTHKVAGRLLVVDNQDINAHRRFTPWAALLANYTPLKNAQQTDAAQRISVLESRAQRFSIRAKTSVKMWIRTGGKKSNDREAPEFWWSTTKPTSARGSRNCWLAGVTRRKWPPTAKKPGENLHLQSHRGDFRPSHAGHGRHGVAQAPSRRKHRSPASSS